ncbi:hypothetical protein EAG_10091 [Camponotus floridanus]|uniref:Uncharacterized protein n=1 Tax=Camponotus floridanus TaxID=104421 RepID=E2A4H7_CAMFO|nr:hypothetical protein EAG_10091 [Camponotus floridanus]
MLAVCQQHASRFKQKIVADWHQLQIEQDHRLTIPPTQERPPPALSLASCEPSASPKTFLASGRSPHALNHPVGRREQPYRISGASAPIYTIDIESVERHATSPMVFDSWFSRGFSGECRGRGLKSSLGRTEGPREDTPLLPEDFSLWRRFLKSVKSFNPKKMCSSKRASVTSLVQVAVKSVSKKEKLCRQEVVDSSSCHLSLGQLSS